MPEFCGCLGSSEPQVTTQVAADPGAGFVRESDSQYPPRYDSVDAGYTPVVPLPRYTARPMSIHEKTLENNPRPMRSDSFSIADEKDRQAFEAPSVQSNSTGSSSATVTATMDDASSAYSFPSSLGHTSTETRDTPPPPYSTCGSSMFSRSRASSFRSHYRNSISSIHYPQIDQNQSSAEIAAVTIMPPPMAHVNRPSPIFAPAAVYHQPRRSHDGR
ncbi:hypothetical protein PISL3812_07106 [Talaromyces islandicus]|uniref:Uncharacterized protein n=1 Tax=Talaromyces islandicus TaxID=28573 RepID=A0A0U1M3D4_TALIS|nr:hypothetical protein PISL3812_07106 [Talaromyces islandicus]